MRGSPGSRSSLLPARLPKALPPSLRRESVLAWSMHVFRHGGTPLSRASPLC